MAYWRRFQCRHCLRVGGKEDIHTAPGFCDGSLVFLLSGPVDASEGGLGRAAHTDEAWSRLQVTVEINGVIEQSRSITEREEDLSE